MTEAIGDVSGLDLSPWVADDHGPGAVVAVLSQGRVLSWAGRGRSVRGGTPLGPRTVFYVASLSKQFTAAAVTLCETAGILDLDASIRDCIPELPPLFEPIRPRHLLHHLGGLPHGGRAGLASDNSADWREGRGLWDLIGLLAQEPRLLDRPGAAYGYSNCGYWLLAGAVERASGQSFGAFARDRLFRPLGMTDSRFRDDPDAPQPGLAPGHERVAGGGVAPVVTRFHAVGDGGLLTTLDDLTKWDLFWSGRSALGPDLPVRLIETGVRDDGRRLYYARGVSVRRHRGLPIVSHGGDFLGYVAKLVRFPDQDLSIACLANAGDLDADGLAMAAADLALASLIDRAAPDWAASVRPDALAE